MTREEAAAALTALATSPAARWIGNRVDGGDLLQKCMRCGAEERLKLPAALVTAHALGASGQVLHRIVPPSFDQRLFAWKRAFQSVHEICLAAQA